MNIKTGRVNPEHYQSQVIFQIEETGNKKSYFLFNIADPASTYPVTYTAATVSDLILSGPFNLSKAKFGRGFISYKIEGTTDTVYVCLDVLKLADASFPAGTGTCPVLTVPADPKKVVVRNCLDPQLGFNTDNFVRLLGNSLKPSSLLGSSGPQASGPTLGSYCSSSLCLLERPRKCLSRKSSITAKE